MTILYNRYDEKELRSTLRNNMPDAERRLWSRLKGRQVGGYKFRRQYSVGPYIIDFYCSELRLAIEIDGPSHFEKDAADKDQERQKFIEKYRISFLRITNTEIQQNLEGVLHKIFETVKNHERTPSNSPL